MLIVEVKKGNVDRALKIMRRKVKLTKQIIKLASEFEKSNNLKKIL